MNPQEQEHLDHVAGSATEHQNCHAESSMANSFHESAVSVQICKMNELGLHVVVEISTAYCRVTDGIIGAHTAILGAFPTKQAAEAFINLYIDKYGYDGECNYDVRSKLPMPPVSHAAEAESHGIDMDDDLPETTREQREADEVPF